MWRRMWSKCIRWRNGPVHGGGLGDFQYLCHSVRLCLCGPAHLDGLSFLFINLFVVIVYWLSGGRIYTGRMQIGDITAIIAGKAMKQLMSGRTSFVIAHRLSTIRDADTILYMEHGNIIEQGSHRELLQKKGAYASLYYSQFE